MKDSTGCLFNVYVLNTDKYMFEHAYRLSGRIQNNP